MVTRTINLGDSEMPVFVQLLDGIVARNKAVSELIHVTEGERIALLQESSIIQSVIAQLEKWEVAPVSGIDWSADVPS